MRTWGPQRKLKPLLGVGLAAEGGWRGFGAGSRLAWLNGLVPGGGSNHYLKNSLL